jgi:hypothetical protein
LVKSCNQICLVGGGTFVQCRNRKIRVIHRGFSTYERKQTVIFRWQIAIELQNKFPDLPLIDPSHITGDRKWFWGNARSFRFELRWDDYWNAHWSR